MSPGCTTALHALQLPRYGCLRVCALGAGPHSASRTKYASSGSLLNAEQADSQVETGALGALRQGRLSFDRFLSRILLFGGLSRPPDFLIGLTCTEPQTSELQSLLKADEAMTDPKIWVQVGMHTPEEVEHNFQTALSAFQEPSQTDKDALEAVHRILEPVKDRPWQTGKPENN